MTLLLLLLLAAAGGCANNSGVNLAADVNRDGVVDFGADAMGEADWTARRGAVFMNNNDSDQDTGEPDHSDEITNGEQDLRDLAVLRLRSMPELPESARVQITIDEESADRVRLFLLGREGDYVSLAKGGEALDATLLWEGDVELRIEANSYSDRAWDGETVVTAAVTFPDGTEESDSVRLRVAPFIMLSNLHEGKTLYVRAYPERNDLFLEQLGELVPAAGAELVVVPAGEPYRASSIWCQDALEIGYSEAPGNRMNVVLRANRNRTLDEFPKLGMLGPDYGWVVCGEYRPELRERRLGNNWLDWYGNLEVTPPLPDHPFGRIYYGANGDESLNPEIVDMLNAQGVQGPAVKLDTGWLAIKHVDEMVCFVPTGSANRPHKVLVPDVDAMLGLLEGWAGEGLGDLPLLQPFGREGTEVRTVASLLADSELVDLNRALQQERIAPNVETLKGEFGLRDSDIIRMPGLFTQRGGSLFPNMVNSVVLNGHFLTSDPHGPEVDGKDLLQEYVLGLLADLPLDVHFLDDRTYHRSGGNVHCATNVRREGAVTPWWAVSPRF
jgi:protein-arginine deiminase